MTVDVDRFHRAQMVIDDVIAEPSPLFPGAVLTVADERDTLRRAAGLAVRYLDTGHELPVEEQVPMVETTIFDLASISKLFTSIVIMQLVERGLVDLDRPVANYLDEFEVDGKRGIKVRSLLTHTSGLPWWLPLWRDFDEPKARLEAALLAATVTEPGTVYCYSDINLITLGEVAHRVAGAPLEVLVRRGVTGPLQMPDTGYNPSAEAVQRSAATEYEADAGRGMVRGQVHDENAWSLGGVAGHAGVFGTAADLTQLARCVLAGGTLNGSRVLGSDSLALMTSNQVEARSGIGHDHGLGFEIGEPWFMGALAGPRTIGHTGFTGTSLVVNLDSGLIVILLTNRVHPSRSGGTINHIRAAVCDALA